MISWHKLIGYGRTLRQYWQTPKGAHDIKDYAKALVLILATMLVALWLVK